MGKADAQLFSWKSRRDTLRSKVLGRKMPATSRGRDHARAASGRTWLLARTAGAELWVENTPDMELCSLREKPRTSVVEYSILPDPLPETPRHRTCPSEILRVHREPAATGTIRDRTGARRGRGRIRPVQGQIRRLHPGRLASRIPEVCLSRFPRSVRKQHANRHFRTLRTVRRIEIRQVLLHGIVELHLALLVELHDGRRRGKGLRQRRHIEDRVHGHRLRRCRRSIEPLLVGELAHAISLLEEDLAAMPDHHHSTRQLICRNRVVDQFGG